MKAQQVLGESFQPNQVWESPKGFFYKVMNLENKPGYAMQAVLRGGANGTGRATRRNWDAVENWTLVRDLHITEGISGMYHYHLSEMSTNATGLCGAKSMNTSLPLNTWGLRGHLRETYCVTCADKGRSTLAVAGVHP